MSVAAPTSSESTPPSPPLWKQLISLDADSEALISILRALMISKEELRCLQQMNSDEAIAFIDCLDQSLSRPNVDLELRGKCLLTLRNTCRQWGELPTSYMLSRGLEKTAIHPAKSGGFADLWPGTYNGSQVAIKALRIYQTSDLGKVRKHFCKEAVVWKHLSHPNVLPFLGISLSLFPFCMVSSWMDHGNIAEYVELHPEANRIELLIDVANGLQYLHSMNLVHADLKGANILVNDENHACLADFGLTQILSDPEVSRMSSSSTSAKGTMRWMAPELLIPEDYGNVHCVFSKQSDIYAFGMVIFEVLTGGSPFRECRDAQVIQQVMSGIRPKRPTEAVVQVFSDDVWRFTEECWHKDPAKRPDVSKAQECLVLAARDWDPQSVVEMIDESPDDDHNSEDVVNEDSHGALFTTKGDPFTTAPNNPEKYESDFFEWTHHNPSSWNVDTGGPPSVSLDARIVSPQVLLGSQKFVSLNIRDSDRDEGIAPISMHMENPDVHEVVGQGEMEVDTGDRNVADVEETFAAIPIEIPSSSTSVIQQTPSHGKSPAPIWDITNIRGQLVPQRRFRPPKALSEYIQLERVKFSVQGESGISARDALEKRYYGLDHRDDPMLVNSGISIFLRFEWPGYKPWNWQIKISNWSKNPLPITRAKLVYEIARALDKFIQAAQEMHTMDDNHEWRVGPGFIDLDCLALVALERVSKASWQPSFRIVG